MKWVVCLSDVKILSKKNDTLVEHRKSKQKRILVKAPCCRVLMLQNFGFHITTIGYFSIVIIFLL